MCWKYNHSKSFAVQNYMKYAIYHKCPKIILENNFKTKLEFAIKNNNQSFHSERYNIKTTVKLQ